MHVVALAIVGRLRLARTRIENGGETGVVSIMAVSAALTQLLLEHDSTSEAERAIDDALERADREGPRVREEERRRLIAMRDLLRANRGRCEWITEIRRTGLDTADGALSADEAIARCERLFDWAVERSEEGSVAAYTLGDPRLLASATAEIVSELAALGVLGPDRDTLEIGCGIGRMQRALAGLVREAYGIDISERMLAVARRRCAGIPNVRFERCTGRDLAQFGASRFHLVYAVDSFPYIQRAGWEMVKRYVAEVARVLTSGGHFVIFNYSYRGYLAADRRDVAELARDSGFEVLVNGDRRLRTWDGVLFHLRLTPPSPPYPSPGDGS
jgi:SAM-dependent methyltransferase